MGIFVQAKVPAKKLRCVSASSQRFAGGAMGSPAGTRYRLTFVAPASGNKLKVDQLWVGKNFYQVNAVNKLNGSTVFSKNDTIEVVTDSYLPVKNHTTSENITQIAVPIEYKGEALIGYSICKKKRYLSIEKFVVLPRENRE